MKKVFLTMIALLAVVAGKAQTILSEDFETGNTSTPGQPVAAGEGWEVINGYTGENASYNWHNYYRDPTSQAGPVISGACCASCDGPINVNPVDGSGPREEILLSPEINLNDTYQLQFTFVVSPMNWHDNSVYDLQVRVVIDGNLGAAETVFSIQNEPMLRESGVTVFPIDDWNRYTSKVDLSEFEGETVRLAFVYKMLSPSANVVWLDDISVSKFTPIIGPKAQVSLNRYDFNQVYIGEKVFSDIITLTNVGQDGLQITGVDFPEGIGINIDTESVNLRRYDKVNFQLSYTATMTTKASGNAILHTTGGDVTIAFTAIKELLPEGYLLVNFNDYFPPAGWKNNGWGWTTTAIEGDHSAYCSGDFSNCYLRSPRLDLNDGGSVTFTYYNQYDGDYAPEYDIELQVSYDGGDNWETKWTSDYQNGLNQLLTETVDLGEGTDDSYIRWYYPAIDSDDEGAYDHSNFYLDRVLLPNVWGMDGVPQPATYLSPASNATNVYPVDVVLQWSPALFADGYKVYVGTNSAANDLINGEDVGDVLTFTIPGRLAYETTYRWKIVPYNSEGNASGVSTWKFTTQPDASVVEFPWTETFNDCTNEVPTGWLSTTDNDYENRRWLPNSLFGYDGTCLYTAWMYAGKQSTLLSPEFTLPADGQNMSISFFWGDEHPRSLIKDETGLLKKQNVPGGNGVSETSFEIFADGQWTQASYLSENYNDDDDTKYWRPETIDLTQYAGKTVQFRWINRALSGRHNGASLDEIVINGTVIDGVAFNRETWDAGKINYGKAKNSGEELTIRNSGKNPLKVTSTAFGTKFFETSITAGTELPVDEGMNFDITFNAQDAEGTVNDVLTIEFENGYTATFPVSGTGMQKDMLFYGFERNPLDYVWDEDFTTKDVDNQVNYMSNYYQTIIENDGGRYAFTLAEHHNENLLAHTGMFTLAAAAPDNNSPANDWLISKQIVPTANTTFDFYARNLSTSNSVFVGDNDLHSVTVLVSEKGNTNTKDFTVLMSTTEMEYLGENEWHHFEVDLSAYAGKPIYVAVQHTTVNANFLAFFDDFTFTALQVESLAGDFDGVGVLCTNDILILSTKIAENTTDTVYDLNGDGKVDVADIMTLT